MIIVTIALALLAFGAFVAVVQVSRLRRRLLDLGARVDKHDKRLVRLEIVGAELPAAPSFPLGLPSVGYRDSAAPSCGACGQMLQSGCERGAAHVV